MPNDLISIAEKPFTAREKELVQAMTRANVTIDVVIPETINPKDWLLAASVTCRVLLRAQLQEQGLMPVLGRLLLIAKENPAIYTENGFEGFEAFIQAEIRDKWGVSRSTCYEAMRQAEFSVKAKLDASDIKEIGRVNMREVIKAIPQGEETKKSNAVIFEKAKTLPTSEFREWLVEKQLIERGETQGAFIRIPTNKAIERRWKKFIENPDVQAVSGSGNPGKILDRMMEECLTEWVTKSGEREKATA